MGVSFEHSYTETLVTEHCYACGIAFAMPKSFRDDALHDRTRGFYCPSGHRQYYTGQTEAQKLAQQLADKERILKVREDQLKASRDAVKALERSNRAVKAHSKRLKTRVAAGVCPAGCKRHFTNLERHIATKHPAWKVEEHA